MSAGIEVKEFKHIPGVNDAEYIKKLEELREIDKGIINTAVAKIKKMSAQLSEQLEIKTDGDTISRQAAIDAVNKICDRCGEHKKYDGVMCGTCYLDGVADIIEDLPFAQPVAKDINVPFKDCISRQSAIDAILAVTGNSSVRELYEHVQEHGLSEMWSGGVNAAIDTIIAVPSAQPEIIMCKDCVNYDMARNGINGYCCFLDVPMYADDWCSRAERKKE